MRTWLVIITLALLACLVVIGLRPDKPSAAGTSATSQSPSFEVRVEKPLSARPLGGLFGLIPADDLAFNHASRGAAIGLVGHDRLKLSAEGWDLSIEFDGEGRVAPGTRLVFPSWLERGGRPVTLRCRPADRGIKIPGFKGWRSRVESWDRNIGHLRITTPSGADEFSGDFLVELATCENVESGKALDWPPAPLTVRGRFVRLPHRVG
jgi:hypothetical protein